MAALSLIPWYAWVAIVGIVSGSVSGIVKMLIDHRERMAMIDRGMNPDDPRPTSKTRIGEL